MATKEAKYSSEELRVILEDSRITTSTEVPEANYVLSIDNVGFFARDDIHAIKAKQKAGKTSTLKVILSTLMGGSLFRLKSLLQEAKVVYFDTEQSRQDTKQILSDVEDLTGLEPDYLDNHLSLHSLRRYSPDQLRHLLIQALGDNHPDVVIIDGLVEMVLSFNDEEESKKLIQSLLVLAEKYHSAIIVVLHTNKNEDDHHMRGHLGTMLAQKAASVLECSNNNGVITVKCTEVRHKEIPTWSIRYDEEGHLQDADILQAEQTKKVKATKEKRRHEEAEQKRKHRMEACIRILDEEGGSMLRKNLVNSLMIVLGEGHSVIQAFIKTQIEAGNLYMVNGNIQSEQNSLLSV